MPTQDAKIICRPPWQSCALCTFQCVSTSFIQFSSSHCTKLTYQKFLLVRTSPFVSANSAISILGLASMDGKMILTVWFWLPSNFYPSRYITSRWPSQNLGSSNTQTRLSSPGFTPQFKKRVHLLLGTHDISNVATLEQFTRDYNVGNHSSFSNKGYRFVLLDSISLSSRATGWRVRTMNAPICSHVDQGGRPVLQTMVRNRCKLRHQLSGATGRLRRV